MNPFYSLVRIVPGSAESDIITVGLLVHSGDRLLLRLSPYKLRLARHFFKADTSGWVDSALRQLQLKVKDVNAQLEKIANPPVRAQQALSWQPAYIEKVFVFEFAEAEYLHRYYNGILQFSAPTPLAVEWDEHVFDLLYKTFVYKDLEDELLPEVNTENVRLFQSRVENKLIRRVADKVNVNLQVREYVLPSLHFQFEMDCIGINGALVGAYAIDFTQSPTTTDKKFGHYLDVINRLVYKYERQDKDNAFYLIADEPESATQSEKAKQWRSWRESPQVRIISSQNVAQVAERIERTNAHRLVQFEDSLSDE